MAGDNNKKPSNNKQDDLRKPPPNDEEITSLLLPSLYRLTEGIPRNELKLMVSEAKACEEALEREIKELKEGLENAPKPGSKKSSVDIMLETEVTPPDGYFTVSALLGRLRDDLATPLPPNSVLPALRAKNMLLQPPPPKKKKTNNNNNPESALEEISTLEKQKQVLALNDNPEYSKEHENPNALLALWKKMSTHRTSVVFRRPVNPKEAPGYTDRILFPMDLSLIRKMIAARMIKSYRDLHQRTTLICHNCVKYNGRESDYGLVTRDFEAMVDEFIVAAVAAESSKVPSFVASASDQKASIAPNTPMTTGPDMQPEPGKAAMKNTTEKK